jgi:hypothetical protein
MTPAELRSTAEVFNRMMAQVDPRREPIVAAIRRSADLLEKLDTMIADATEKLRAANTAPQSSVNDNLKVLYASRLSALQDLAN